MSGLGFAPSMCACGKSNRQNHVRRVTGSVATLALAVALNAGAAHGVGVRNGRLEGCKAEQNCISTAAIKNPSKFSAPWSYQPQTGAADVAWNSLVEIVTQSTGAEVLEVTDSYLHATFPGFPRGLDDVEFLLNEDEGIVSYRSCSREVIFVYPLQQPIGDLGRNSKRLQAIREQLGWEILDGGYAN